MHRLKHGVGGDQCNDLFMKPCRFQIDSFSINQFILFLLSILFDKFIDIESRSTGHPLPMGGSLNLFARPRRSSGANPIGRDHTLLKTEKYVTVRRKYSYRQLVQRL